MPRDKKPNGGEYLSDSFPGLNELKKNKPKKNILNE